MPNFPASLDNGSSLPTPAAGNNTNSPSHAGLHGAENAAIIATETKLGTGATVPAASQLLVGTGAGTSAWQGLTSAQLAAILSDETGTGNAVFANTPVLITPKVDTINENTLSNGVTVGGVNMSAGVVTTAGAVGTTALAANSVTSVKQAVGVCVQQVSSLTSAVATGTTTIPLDDTIPQNTEGDQYMSLAITPKSTTNTLEVQVNIFCSVSVNTANAIAALFQDTTANALAVNHNFNGTATAPAPISLLHTMTAGTLSATTFKVRIGGSGASTITFNGQSGTRQYGAITKSSIVIREYKS